MYVQLEMDSLIQTMKPEIIESLVLIDKTFEELDYIQHDIDLNAIGTNPDIEHALNDIEIENIYRDHAASVMAELGLSLTTETAPTYLLADLLSVLEDIGRYENKDFVQDVYERVEEPLLFFYLMISEFSQYSAIEFYPYVDDFDNDSILEIRNRVEDELEDEDLLKIRLHAERGRKVLRSFDPEEINIALGYIKSRDAHFAFGFSFKVAVFSLQEKLQFYIDTRDFGRVRNELIALAMASSLESSIITETLMETLEDMDIDIRTSLAITGPIESNVNKILESFNEDNNKA